MSEEGNEAGERRREKRKASASGKRGERSTYLPIRGQFFIGQCFPPMQWLLLSVPLSPRGPRGTRCDTLMRKLEPPSSHPPTPPQRSRLRRRSPSFDQCSEHEEEGEGSVPLSRRGLERRLVEQSWDWKGGSGIVVADAVIAHIFKLYYCAARRPPRHRLSRLSVSSRARKEGTR